MTGIIEIPDRIAIIGGGVVACEAATWLAALSSSVTMLVRDDRLLGRIEPFAADLVAEGLRAAGVEIRLGAEVSAADRPVARDRGLGRIHGGPVTITVAGDDVIADELLVAIGRRPRRADVGLDSIGLDSIGLDDTHLAAKLAAKLAARGGDAQVAGGDAQAEDGDGQAEGGDAQVAGRDAQAEGGDAQVAGGDAQAEGGDGQAEGGDGIPEWLVFVGDASGEAALTHWGKHRARVLGAQLAAHATGGAAPWGRANVPVPQVIFTDPAVASVRLTEREARDAGHRISITKVPWTAAAGAALLRDDIAGSAQLVVDEDTHVILGATFVGPDAAELIHAATVAIVGAIPTETLRFAVPSYPHCERALASPPGGPAPALPVPLPCRTDTLSPSSRPFPHCAQDPDDPSVHSRAARRTQTGPECPLPRCAQDPDRARVPYRRGQSVLSTVRAGGGARRR